MKIEIRANAETFEIEDGTSVEDFIRKIGVDIKRCVVELNGDVLKREIFSGTALKSGDVLEIMQIVAGG